MYNINEMVSVMGKRKKMPTTLGVNIGAGVILIAPEKSRDGPEQKWTAEKMTHYSIEGKHVFIELVKPSKSLDFHAGAKDTAQEIVSALGELAGAVRAGELLEVGRTGGGKKTGQMLYEFMAQGDDEVTVAVGDEVIIIDDSKSDEWWQVRRVRNGKEGVVPSSYVEITGVTEMPSSSSGINAGRTTVEQNREEEVRKTKEAIKAAQRAEDSRAHEVGPGVRLPERGSSLASQGDNNNGQQRSRQQGGRGDGQSRSSKASKSEDSEIQQLNTNVRKEPDSSKVRQWTDRSKSFSVEAQFLGLKDGKINLHKLNGVKIAVPVVKMSVEDLEYVERVTGVSLDEDKPLSNIKKHQSRRDNQKEASPSSGAGVSIEKKPDYDWFGFFLSCDVAVGLCERYAQTFNRDSMDESVLPDVDVTVLRTLGIREGDIIKIMRFLDKKYGRIGGKRTTGTGGEDSMNAEGESGGLFSGPGGTLRNNTRKGRPAPAVQTNDVVDPKAFSQEPKSARSEALTPSSSIPAPAPAPVQKDRAGNGFDDDAWDVKPSKQVHSQPASSQPTQTSSASAPPASQPALTGSLQDLSLLSQPLQPVRVQPTAPPTSAAEAAPHPQVQSQQVQQQPPQVTPTFFQGIGQQQTGLSQQQQSVLPNQFQQTGLPQNIARQRPTPPAQFQSQNSALMIPAPPSRPLSAPQVNQNSAFAVPPLQAQNTGMPNSSFQQQIAPPGQSLNDIRMQQQFTNFNNTQNPQNMAMLPQPTGFQQFNGMPQPVQQQPTGMQYPMQTGMQPQQFMNNGGSPFADPRSTQFSPIQQQPTGFQSSFGPPAQQQFPQQTGVNTFLPPALQPTPTGMQSQPNSFSSFNPPPMPPMPQQNTAMPLIPQKTGPPPPVRFGVSADAKKLMPQPTGRRANLSQASKLFIANLIELY